MRDDIMIIPFEPDRRFELRGQLEPVRGSKKRIVWRAYRNGIEVHEIVKSADPNLVKADLAEWLSSV